VVCAVGGAAGSEVALVVVCVRGQVRWCGEVAVRHNPTTWRRRLYAGARKHGMQPRHAVRRRM